MLFFSEFPAKNHDANEKKINSATNSGMIFDRFPGLFHFPAPVYIIKNQYRIIVCSG
jgi:hypothetical protein